MHATISRTQDRLSLHSRGRFPIHCPCHNIPFFSDRALSDHKKETARSEQFGGPGFQRFAGRGATSGESVLPQSVRKGRDGPYTLLTADDASNQSVVEEGIGEDNVQDDGLDLGASLPTGSEEVDEMEALERRTRMYLERYGRSPSPATERRLGNHEQKKRAVIFKDANRKRKQQPMVQCFLFTLWSSFTFSFSPSGRVYRWRSSLNPPGVDEDCIAVPYVDRAGTSTLRELSVSSNPTGASALLRPTRVHTCRTVPEPLPGVKQPRRR